MQRSDRSTMVDQRAEQLDQATGSSKPHWNAAQRAHHGAGSYVHGCVLCGSCVLCAPGVAPAARPRPPVRRRPASREPACARRGLAALAYSCGRVLHRECSCKPRLACAGWAGRRAGRRPPPPATADRARPGPTGGAQTRGDHGHLMPWGRITIRGDQGHLMLWGRIAIRGDQGHLMLGERIASQSEVIRAI